MRTRTEIKMTEGEREAVETLAEYLNWGLSETVRRALKFGLQSLLKFETGDKKADLKTLILDRRKRSKGQPEQKNDNTNQDNEITEESTRDMYEMEKDLYNITESFEEWLPKFREKQKKAKEERIKAMEKYK